MFVPLAIALRVSGTEKKILSQVGRTLVGMKGKLVLIECDLFLEMVFEEIDLAIFLLIWI